MAYNILPISANQLHVIQSQLLWVNEYLHLHWPDNSKDPTWLVTQVSENIAVRGYSLCKLYCLQVFLTSWYGLLSLLRRAFH